VKDRIAELQNAINAPSRCTPPPAHPRDHQRHDGRRRRRRIALLAPLSTSTKSRGSPRLAFGRALDDEIYSTEEELDAIAPSRRQRFSDQRRACPDKSRRSIALSSGRGSG